MIRAFLDDFLNIGVLTYRGHRVCVDGFSFTNNLDEIYTIAQDKVITGCDRNEES
jgi:hypothetical protein